MDTLVTMQFLLDVPDDDGTSACAAMNEILRGKQREFDPESCLIKYTFREILKIVYSDTGTRSAGTRSAGTRSAGDAFTEGL